MNGIQSLFDSITVMQKETNVVLGADCGGHHSNTRIPPLVILKKSFFIDKLLRLYQSESK